MAGACKSCAEEPLVMEISQGLEAISPCASLALPVGSFFTPDLVHFCNSNLFLQPPGDTESS